WSYDLLTGAEKTVLRRLSVFVGGWTLAAAEAVCSGGGVPAEAVLDLLTSLVDKSLVVYEEKTNDTGGAGDTEEESHGEGAGRSRLLETVRQYAGDRLAESGEQEAVRERAAVWFLEMAETAQPELTGPEQARWLRRLESEHDNLRASLLWYEREAGGERGVRLVGALWQFWAVRGHLGEGRRWLDQALSRPASTGKEGEGAEASEAEAAARGKALNGAGALAYSQGDYAAARTRYAQSLAVRRRLGDPRSIAASLINLGNVVLEEGDWEGARSLYEESLALLRPLGDPRFIANALGNLGLVAHYQGDYARARALHEESVVERRRQVGDHRGIAFSLINLGNVSLAQGDYASAQAQFEESLAILRPLGDRQFIANALGNLGLVALRQGEYERSRALQGESLTILLQLGDQHGTALLFEGLSGVAHGEGHMRRVACLLGAAAALRNSIGNPPTLVEQAELDERAAQGREVLGKAAFAAAWDAGQAMTAEQAAAYAMSRDDEV
ncbi:MAG: tetratricopeptide repeat protein, partial [Cytophagales bacterium]|nr:tetratricopeptide repeat protein [Armatimonadota bacterium]